MSTRDEEEISERRIQSGADKLVSVRARGTRGKTKDRIVKTKTITFEITLKSFNDSYVRLLDQDAGPHVGWGPHERQGSCRLASFLMHIACVSYT